MDKVDKVNASFKITSGALFDWSKERSKLESGPFEIRVRSEPSPNFISHVCAIEKEIINQAKNWKKTETLQQEQEEAGIDNSTLENLGDFMSSLGTNEG